VEDFTGFPEIMDGRVKTLHPRLYAGLLARRDEPSHMTPPRSSRSSSSTWCASTSTLRGHGRPPRRDGGEIVENIDIGGPTMIRAAAKNAAFAAVVVRPESYDAVLQELQDTDGRLSLATRETSPARRSPHRALRHRDRALVRREAGRLPAVLMTAYEKVTDLSYGENPHQRAAYYAQVGARMHVLSMVRQLAARSCRSTTCSTSTPAACWRGVRAAGLRDHQAQQPVRLRGRRAALEAYERAFACDPLSAFGGVICVNRAVDASSPRLASSSARCSSRRATPRKALDILCTKQNLRILEDNERRHMDIAERDYKRVIGGPARPGSRRRPRGPHRDAGRHRAQARASASGARCCSPGRSASTCAPTPSCSRTISPPSASAPADEPRGRRSGLALSKASETGADLRGAAWPSDAFLPLRRRPADWPSTPASRRSSSPAGQCATRRSWKPPTRPGISMVFTHRRHFKH
jgi:phosphoribosylaminoimidazolecarboxamide formyltransferase/IMP cyclohydrolase